MLNSNTRKLLSVINKYDCIGRGPFYFFAGVVPGFLLIILVLEMVIVMELLYMPR